MNEKKCTALHKDPDDRYREAAKVIAQSGVTVKQIAENLSHNLRELQDAPRGGRRE